jgi:hypothetical protein
VMRIGHPAGQLVQFCGADGTNGCRRRLGVGAGGSIGGMTQWRLECR